MSSAAVTTERRDGVLIVHLDDGKANALARAFSAVALGIIGEKTDLPWNAVISENFNYRAKVDALSEVLDIL